MSDYVYYFRWDFDKKYLIIFRDILITFVSEDHIFSFILEFLFVSYILSPHHEICTTIMCAHSVERDW